MVTMYLVGRGKHTARYFRKKKMGEKGRENPALGEVDFRRQLLVQVPLEMF